MRAGRRAVAAVLVAAALMPLGSGCWDARELNQLALVMAVGIDQAAESGRYTVTVQIARPGGQEGKSRGGGSGDASGGEPIYVAAADGDTIFAAIRNLAQFTSRRIMWAHNNVVVIGESLARRNITPVVDFFTRNQELRMRTWVVVAKGTDARYIVSAQTGIERVPADSISALFRYAQLPGESIKSDVNDVSAAFFSPDLTPVLAAVQLNERALRPSENPRGQGKVPQVELAGIAIFERTRLIGFVERETSRGLLWLRRQMRNASLTLPCPGSSDEHMAIEIRGPRVTVTPRLVRGLPAFHLHVDSHAWLTEQDCREYRVDAVQLKEHVRKELERKIAREVQATMKVLQTELKQDAVRFGHLTHVRYPAWWKANRPRWRELFPQVPVTVSAEIRIPKMGLYVRPEAPEAPE